MDPLAPLKMAYEFMACHVGGAIYGDAWDQIRQALRQETAQAGIFEVERLTSEKYEPFHGLCFEGNEPHARVQIRLFGWLVFRVHFLLCRVSGARFIYTHDLEAGREYLNTLGAKKAV